MLPKKIETSDVELDFLDPERLGGLRPVGELIKSSYYYLILWIIMLAVFVYAPQLFDQGFQTPVKPSPLVNFGFTVVWIACAGSLGYALYVFHRYMKKQKQKKLLELDEEYRELTDGPWDITAHKIPDENLNQAEHIQNRIDRITATKEYPATFSMWSQVIIGLILPKAIQLVLSSV